MCKANILSHNQFGCIVKRSGCGQINLAFGNVFLCFSEEDFFSFCKYIAGVHNKHIASMKEERKTLLLTTEQKNLMVALNGNELKKLNDMLNESLLMLDVNNILSKAYSKN